MEGQPIQLELDLYQDLLPPLTEREERRLDRLFPGMTRRDKVVYTRTVRDRRRADHFFLFGKYKDAIRSLPRVS